MFEADVVLTEGHDFDILALSVAQSAMVNKHGTRQSHAPSIEKVEMKMKGI
jgi:hypothetical protein